MWYWLTGCYQEAGLDIQLIAKACTAIDSRSTLKERREEEGERRGGGEKREEKKMERGRKVRVSDETAGVAVLLPCLQAFLLL